jgi:hypothetical protein
MSHSVWHESADNITFIRYEGVVDFAALQAGATDAARLAIGNDCRRILIDCRQAELAFTTLEIYQLPTELTQLLSSSGRSIHDFSRALLIAHHTPDFTFLETVMQNRLHNMTLFFTEEAARAWLLQK